MTVDPLRLSILDAAIVGSAETARDTFEGCVVLAQRAEELGYRRVWYAEHHNIDSIASSATAVLIAHVAAHTTRIRLGAGGIMLPNHAPLIIAEQFGTLATLHPDRIDLGLGRAPGSDQNTMRALRRDPMAAETFPQDILELQGYLSGHTRIPHVNAVPGKGTNVPLYILGSSLYGAQLAAVLGLPYGYASHFAPHSLQDAVALYRAKFQPSEQLDHPHVIAGVNVITAATDEAAREQFHVSRRARVRNLFSRDGHRLTDDEAENILGTPQSRHIDEMMTYTGVGTPDVVRDYLADFRKHADADELMVAFQGDSIATRVRSVELVAEATGIAAVR